MSKEVGIGEIIRDSMAALVAKKGRSFLASSTLEVEALAMHEGLLLADNKRRQQSCRLGCISIQEEDVPFQLGGFIPSSLVPILS